MPPEEALPYDGPYVCIRPDGPAYTVMIDPPLPTGEGVARSFGSKVEAWSAAQFLWSQHRLPLRDFTDGHVEMHYRDK